MTTMAPPKPGVPLVGPSKGGTGSLSGLGGGGDSRRPSLPEGRYYTGMMLGLAAVTMLFAAFTSALVVRKGLSDDWVPIRLPGILGLSSLLLLASSATIEKARRCLNDPRAFRSWWSATTLLGLAFLSGQLIAWRQLADRGFYLSSNPANSFFYVLTGAHGIHLAGGVIALLYIAWRFRSTRPGSTVVGVTTLYWHFMDGLWIYLLLLILLWS